MEDKKIHVVDTKGNGHYVSYSDLMRGVYSNLSKIQLRNLQSNRDTNPTQNKYTKSQIVTYLDNPASYEKQLRNMSIYLFNTSNYYRRLVQYFANMSTFSYVVVPIGLDRSKSINQNKLKKAYYQTIASLERMNIQHEFSKALTIAFRDDVYYGYAWETNESFAFQNLDADYCKICGIEDGCYNFAFDFSYFDSNKEKLSNYAPEFEAMYNQYKKDGQNYKWQELDSSKSICLKVNEHTYIPTPPFVSLFGALADIEDYKAISKDASESNNYKAMVLEIPINQDDGSFLIDYEQAKEFYDMMCNVLPPNIGGIMSPMRVSSYSFDRSGAMADSNEVAKAEASMWAQAGVNRILFGGGDDPSASTLGLCTVNDQMIVFAMMKQIERWINRKLKLVSSAYKFKVNFLPVTQYNREAMHKQYLTDGQYGFPVRSAVMATGGYSPFDIENMSYLENTVLGLPDSETPFKSSNTQTGNPGRPTNESNGEPLSEAGEITADRAGE